MGFDFDKVFIDYPPFIPYVLIDFLYKGSAVFKNKSEKKIALHYRFPGVIEQKVRILSHFPIFRQPIQKNIETLKTISSNKKNKTYLVSSRYGFLRERTDILINKYKLKKYFKEIHFNYENQQPHIFKEATIRSLKIDTYIDDDLDLSLYLSKKLPKLKIFWICIGQGLNTKLPKNIIAINDLGELKKYLKKDG